MTNSINQIFNKMKSLDKQSQVNNKAEIKPNNTGLEQDTFQKSGINQKKKIGITAALVATAIVIGGVIINKTRKAQAFKNIPKDLKTMFEELKGLEGEEFISKAYSKLQKHMKLDGFVSNKIKNTGPDKGMRAIGGYNPSMNTIEFSEGFFDGLEKADQFAMMAHELKHAEQIKKIIQSGKIEQYADAWAESNMKLAKSNTKNTNFHRAWNEAIKQGKGDEFLAETHNNMKQEIYDAMQVAHKPTLELPQYPVSSKEYQEAENYIKATRNYTGLDELGHNTPEYDTNIMEKEAYGYSNMMLKHFKTFFD